ncbi:MULTISPECIES: nucleotide exchange factor GrpE [Halococcus]|uniref:Protein GrpE n=1 Tax=Halococcus salifodinae DSM 8989 TaxID=1227456 RepID=M0MY80_9EURY|nr:MULTISPECIES: nucleotide exchange factor GrpE [Halococcus]EMA49809.1 dnaJ/dnaK ATPase stimulator grpE [Halococcus salifodinae DSM 8989]
MSEDDAADVTDPSEPAESAADEPTSEASSPSESAAGGAETGAVGEELEARVADASTEELAREIAGLRERAAAAERELEERTEEIDDLESKLKRKQADFQNYKQRTERQQEELQERATEDLVERLLDVRDNLARALSQDDDADIRPGVESTFAEFDRVLDEENLTTIEPEPGSEVDPQRHEVMMSVESDQPGDTVAEVFRPGYEMGEKVLRPAQITVSE